MSVPTRPFARGVVTAEEALRARVAPLAAVGRFELYKTTLRFGADEGASSTVFPPPRELPL